MAELGDLLAGFGVPGTDCSPAVRAHIASSVQDIGAQITTVSGPQATLGELTRASSGDTEALVVAGDGCDTWAELVRSSDDGEAETCLLALRHDRDGLIDRVVWHAAPRVEGFCAAGEQARPPARLRFEEYFRALQEARFGAAAECFDPNVIWSHPPYRGAPVRELARGRAALLDLLVHRRGASPARQVITGFAQRGCHVFLEGIVEGIPHGGSFVSLGQLSSDTEIGRYVAFYSAERYAGSSPAGTAAATRANKTDFR